MYVFFKIDDNNALSESDIMNGSKVQYRSCSILEEVNKEITDRYNTEVITG